MSQIAENFDQILRMIRKGEKAAGRKEGSVELVAVSKTQPVEAIREALATGHRCFGENRVQEAQEHWTGLRKDFPDLQLHLIGPLQTNKVKEAVALFDCIETLDRDKLAQALRDELTKQGRALPCFIQVNTGEEEQKAGILPQHLAEFYRYCVEEVTLNVTGLMCIPPVEDPPALHFALLQKWARHLNLPHLSMGMSADFLKAIPLGATHVRVGTALFGRRETPV